MNCRLTFSRKSRFHDRQSVRFRSLLLFYSNFIGMFYFNIHYVIVLCDAGANVWQKFVKMRFLLLFYFVFTLLILVLNKSDAWLWWFDGLCIAFLSYDMGSFWKPLQYLHTLCCASNVCTTSHYIVAARFSAKDTTFSMAHVKYHHLEPKNGLKWHYRCLVTRSE